MTLQTKCRRPSPHSTHSATEVVGYTINEILTYDIARASLTNKFGHYSLINE